MDCKLGPWRFSPNWSPTTYQPTQLDPTVPAGRKHPRPSDQSLLPRAFNRTLYNSRLVSVVTPKPASAASRLALSTLVALRSEGAPRRRKCPDGFLVPLLFAHWCGLTFVFLLFFVGDRWWGQRWRCYCWQRRSWRSGSNSSASTCCSGRQADSIRISSIFLR